MARIMGDVGRNTASMSAVIHGLRLMLTTSAVAHVVQLVYGHELWAMADVTMADVDGWRGRLAVRSGHT
jgi:hypothetical protein